MSGCEARGGREVDMWRSERSAGGEREWYSKVLNGGSISFQDGTGAARGRHCRIRRQGQLEDASKRELLE